MLHKYIYIFLLISVLCFSVKAQTFDFKPGYIISTSDDTVRGYIYYDTQIKNSAAIKFKQNPTQQTYDVYTPEHLKAYSLEGIKICTSQKVSVRSQVRHLFLTTVVIGYVSLYHAKVKGEDDLYFLQKEGGELIYLNKKILIPILGSYLSDCKHFDFTNLSAVSKYKNTYVSLTNTITHYNHCVKPNRESELKLKKEKVPTKLGIKLGGSTNNLSYPREGSSFYKEKFEDKKSIMGSLYLNFQMTKTWSFQPELTFITKGGSLKKPMVTNVLYYEKVDFALNYLQLPAAFKYSLPINRIRPFLLFGPVLSCAVGKKAVYREMRTIDHTEAHRYSISVDRLAYGYFAGVGVSLPVSASNMLHLETRYDKSATNMNYVYNKIIMSSIQLTAGISF